VHRDIRTANRYTPPDGHTWRRIWWMLVQFDVTVALSYGRPQAMYVDPQSWHGSNLTPERIWTNVMSSL
jgi:hypothetical protein